MTSTGEEEGRRTLVLVDGTNVARSSEWGIAALRAGEQGTLHLEDLVSRLVDAVASWASIEGVDVLMAFDGAGPTHSAGGACQIVGSGARSADEVLERAAAEARHQRRTHWVASSDRTVQQVAGAAAERVLDAPAFVHEVQRAGVEATAPAAAAAGAGAGVTTSADRPVAPGGTPLGQHADDQTRDALERMRRGLM